MEQLNWSYLDFLIITGDAYVDHPSFGAAIIGRYLEYLGFKVGIIPQPDWRDAQSLLRLGTPGLGVLITAGNLDSMLNHYTSRKKKRARDLYSPGGQMGLRPDRATIVYTNLAKQVFRNKPIIIGGIEASLRRFAHYDYWDNKVRRSILFDSKADLLVYGMAEYQIERIARGLKEGKPWSELTTIPGICYISEEKPADYLEIPSFEECTASKEAFARAFAISYGEQDPIRGKGLVQLHQDRYLIQNPPAPPLTQAEMDQIYNLPYSRTYHPSYKNNPIPALEEIKFSITSHRGCFGACAFCALHFHQGRIIQNRSHQSILREAYEMTLDPDFKGYIHDVGGPTANFRQPSCKKQLKYGTCRDRQCLVPKPCPQLEVDHSDYLQLLRSVRKIPKIKKVFVRSGLRYDYLLLDKKSPFLYELCEHHISGQLKVAPEHAAPNVTSLMGKAPITVFDQFHQAYSAANKRLNKKQYLIPYFMSGHPGTTLPDAIYLAEYLRDFGFQPDQVQEFIPTPGSLSTCMYYTGIDPFTYKKVHVPDAEERLLQRALLQYKKPENYPLVLAALKKAGRQDLIGTRKECLIPPPQKDKHPKASFTKLPTGVNKKWR